MRERFIVPLAGMTLVWMVGIMGLVYGLRRVAGWWERPQLVVAAWGDIIHPEVIRAFQEQTGITVNMSYYASNEELLVKLSRTNGVGYDIVVPSDYMAAELIAQGLLAPLDHAQLDVVDRIVPCVKNLWCDPENTYVIPWSWEPYVIGYRRDSSNIDPMLDRPWDMVFRPQGPVVMINDALEMVTMAGVYALGHAGPYSPAEQQRIVALLRQQRPGVVAYADARGDYFLRTGAAQVMISGCSYILSARGQSELLGWVLPNPSFVTVEHIGIVRGTAHAQAAYAFLRYLYRVESVQKHYRTYGTLPATIDIVSDEHAGAVRALFEQAVARFDTFYFFKPVINRLILNQMWVATKS